MKLLKYRMIVTYYNDLHSVSFICTVVEKKEIEEYDLMEDLKEDGKIIINFQPPIS